VIYTGKTQNDVFLRIQSTPTFFSTSFPFSLSSMLKTSALLRSLSKNPFNSRHSLNRSNSFFSSVRMGDAVATKKQINLLRGWPNPSLLPTSQIQVATNAALSDASVSTPGLLYGPDPGYQPLRQSIAEWLDGFYRPTSTPIATTVSTTPNLNPQAKRSGASDAERICITGGASQNLACVLQVFTDPVYTTVFMVAPCYFLACRIFEDAGLRTRAVAEGEEGVDLEALEKGLREAEMEKVGKVSADFVVLGMP
jgi:DNA-binding transcriptional MocR family regulator